MPDVRLATLPKRSYVNEWRAKPRTTTFPAGASQRILSATKVTHKWCFDATHEVTYARQTMRAPNVTHVRGSLWLWRSMGAMETWACCLYQFGARVQPLQAKEGVFRLLGVIFPAQILIIFVTGPTPHTETLLSGLKREAHHFAHPVEVAVRRRAAKTLPSLECPKHISFPHCAPLNT